MNFQNETYPFHRSAADVVQIQNSFVNRVFGWMTLGLAVTALVSYYLAANHSTFIFERQGLFLILMLAEIALVIGLSAAIRRISPFAAFCGFMLFAALNGVSLSWIFLVYTANSVASAFFSTSLTFGVMGLYGWVTKRDLTTLGNLCMMGLIGLIIASLINIFVGSSGFNLLISCFGVLLFVGLTAYDTQKIKRLSVAVSEGEISESDGKKLAVLGALELYLDFINLFLYMLRFFGDRK